MVSCRVRRRTRGCWAWANGSSRREQAARIRRWSLRVRKAVSLVKLVLGCKFTPVAAKLFLGVSDERGGCFARARALISSVSLPGICLQSIPFMRVRPGLRVENELWLRPRWAVGWFCCVSFYCNDLAITPTPCLCVLL